MYELLPLFWFTPGPLSLGCVSVLKLGNFSVSEEWLWNMLVPQRYLVPLHVSPLPRDLFVSLGPLGPGLTVPYPFLHLSELPLPYR